MKSQMKREQLNILENALTQEYPELDIEQISQMARKVVEQFQGVRQKSKSIKKDNSICSSSANNTLLKNANSLQTTLNSTQASQLNSSASNQNAPNNNNNNNNNLSISSSTTASLSSIQKRVKFTQQEDDVILKYVQKHGKKWSEISKRLPGRTEVMVRNRYYVKIRKLNKEREGGADLTQNDDAGYFNAEISSQEFNNEQASDIFLGTSQSGIANKYNQSSQQIQQIAFKEEKQRSHEEHLNGNTENYYNQNSNNFPIYNAHNLHNSENIFDSPIKQGIFEDDGMMGFAQNNANNNNNNLMDSLHNFEEHHRHHLNQHKDQHLFDSAIKEFPENLQNSHFYEQSHQNLNINQNNEFYDHNIHTSKAALLQNQQYTQLPFQNGIEGLQLQHDDDDFFEEANKPFKLPKIFLPEDDLNDISAILPPIGQMDLNTLNNQSVANCSNIINSAMSSAQIDCVKQEKITFLQNQISMIENMLNMCKDEIIREFAQRKSISTNADTNKNFNQTPSSSTPVEQFVNVKQEPALQDQEEVFSRLQGLDNQHQFVNTSMEIEEGNNKGRFLFEHDEHEMNATDNFNYHLNEQNQMITSLNNF